MGVTVEVIKQAGRSPKDKVSPAAYFFFAEQSRLLLLFILLFRYQTFATLSGKKFVHFLEDEATGLAAVDESTKRYFYDLHEKSRWQPFIYELFFCRQVEVFEKYLKDLLVLIFRKHRNALKSRDNVSLEEVLGYTDMEEFVEAYIQRKVEKTSFSGLETLLGEFEKLGLRRFLDKDDCEKIKKSFIIRNRIIHRNILAAEVEKRKIFNRYVAELRELYGEFEDCAEYFYLLVTGIDKKVVSKFDIGVTNKAIGTWTWGDLERP
jgi:hypothetical protein